MWRMSELEHSGLWNESTIWSDPRKDLYMHRLLLFRTQQPNYVYMYN